MSQKTDVFERGGKRGLNFANAISCVVSGIDHIGQLSCLFVGQALFHRAKDRCPEPLCFDRKNTAGENRFNLCRHLACIAALKQAAVSGKVDDLCPLSQLSQLSQLTKTCVQLLRKAVS